MKIEIKPTDTLARKIAFLSKMEGVTPEEFVAALAKKAIARLSNDDVDLTASEVAARLGCCAHTVKRYYKAGKFPNAYKLNARVIRFKAEDVEKLKAAS